MDATTGSNIILFLPSLLVLIGICWFAGLNHLLLWIKQRDNRSYLLFGILCFIVVFYIFAQYSLYQAETVEAVRNVLKFRDLFFPLFFIGFSWFIYLLINKKPDLYLYSTTSLWTFLFIMTWFLPNGHIMKDVHEVIEYVLPWGETIKGFEGDFHVYFGTIDFLLSLSVFVYACYSGIVLTKKQDRHKGIPLIVVGFVWFLSILNDILIDMDLIQSIYTGEFVFGGTILLLTYSLSYDYYILKVKSTEKEIALLKVLRESEERYRSFFETARDAAYITTQAGDFLDCNEGFVELMGFQSRVELMNMKVIDLYANPNDRKGVLKAILKNRFISRLPITLKKKDNSLVHALMAATVIEDEDSNIKGFQGTLTDITELKKAEGQLKEESERLRLAMEAAQMGTWNWNIQENHVDWSPETMRIFGTNPEDFAGTLEGYVQFIAPVMNEEITQLVQDFLAKPREHAIIQYEHEMIRGDGTSGWVEVRGTLFLDKQNQPHHMVGVCADVTERKRLEKELETHRQHLEDLVNERTLELEKAKDQAEALNRSLEFIQFAVDNTVDAATWLNLKDSTLFYVNEALINLVGYSEKELIGQPISFIDPAYTMEVWPDFAKKLKKGQPLKFESALYSKQGDRIPIEVTAQYVKYGKEDRVIAFCRNITDRKQAEEEITHAKEKLELAIAAASMGVWDWDVKNNILVWDDSLYELFGVKREDFSGAYDAWAKTLHPEDAESAQKDVELALKGEKDFSSEFRIVYPDRTVRHVLGKAIVHRDEEDEPIRMTGINMDITDRKLSEETLRYSLALSQKTGEMTEEEMLKAFLDEGVRLTSSRIGFFHFVDTDKQIVELKTWTGAVMDSCEVEEVRPGYPIAEAGIWVECIETKVPVIHNDYQTASNRKGLPEGHVPVIRDMEVPVMEGSRVVAIIGVGNKDTEYTQTDLDRLAFLATNAWGNIRRTRAVTELRTAREAAEAANRAKSTFLANMSHEIRTPMNAILGHSQIMQRDKSLSNEQRKSINSINKSGEHLLTLINDVLDMSKIEAGKIKLLSISFRLHHLLREMVEMFHSRVKQKGLLFELDIQPDLPDLILADENRVRQILINLLGNAVKFTEKGGIHLIGGFRQDTIHIEVSDTGSGIPEDRLESIFEAFEQTEKGMWTLTGTGLGLAISRNMARLMNGDITVKSTIKKGSAFSFHFPYKKGEARDVEEKGPKRMVSKLKAGQADARILIVDDREENRIVARKLLGDIGFEIREAENGKVAVKICKAWKPRVILMDVVMPVMDGREATRKIKSLDMGKDITIIAVSASALDEEREEIMSYGADAFIKKPFKESELLEEIRYQTGLVYEYDELQASEDEEESADFYSLFIKLPVELREQLHQAAVLGNMTLLSEIIKDVAEYDQQLAEHLQYLIDDFQLDELGNLLL